MNVGSLFSGVGGFDLGLERAGMRVVFQCERDTYRRRVLARHWPGVPVYDDVRSVQLADGRLVGLPRVPGERNGRVAQGSDPGRVDLLHGGFPCQDLSVAGRRRGLAGDRSGLFFEFARIADALLGDGGFVLIENVPGLLSSHGGRDFAVLLATLAELGFHDLAWRVLDSRYFGVPQRRRRVYILGRRSRGRVCAEVLLEPEGGGGHPAPGGEAGARVAASLSRGSSSAGVSAPGRRQEDDENIVPAIVRRYGKGTDSDATDAFVIGEEADADRVRTPPRVPGRLDGAAVSIHPDAIGRDGLAKTDSPDAEGIYRKRDAGLGVIDDGSSYTLNTGPPPAVFADAPLESAVPFDPKPDGPRYAAMGDAVTVNVAEWIGRRLMGRDGLDVEAPQLGRDRRTTQEQPGCSTPPQNSNGFSA